MMIIMIIVVIVVAMLMIMEMIMMIIDTVSCFRESQDLAENLNF